MPSSAEDLLFPLLQYSPLILLASPTTTPLYFISAAFNVDALHLTLGCGTPFDPSHLNSGEFPACAAMTTGYVFRVENEATIHFLQAIGTTGGLTRLKVWNESVGKTWWTNYVLAPSPSLAHGLVTIVALVILWFLSYRGHSQGPLPDTLLTVFSLCRFTYFRGSQVSVATTVLSAGCNVVLAMAVHERLRQKQPPSIPFMIALYSLFASRILFAYVLSQRTKSRWHGAAEPDVKGSLLVLLSRDRWIRIDGDVDDLKAVTSGAWLLPGTGWQELWSQLSCLLVWVSTIAGLTAENSEKLVLLLLVLVRHLFTAWAVRRSILVRDGLALQGRKVEVDKSKGRSGVKEYGRRLEMAGELIQEFGRRDWAEQMGLVKPGLGQERTEVIM